RGMKTGHKLEKRGFSAAARPHDRDEFALVDTQIHVGEGEHSVATSSAVKEVGVFNLDKWLSCGGSHGVSNGLSGKHRFGPKSMLWSVQHSWTPKSGHGEGKECSLHFLDYLRLCLHLANSACEESVAG